MRVLHGKKRVRPLVTIDLARERRLRIEWKREDIAVPSFTGARTLRAEPLAEIAKAIDWTFFFTAWELKGRFPQILEDPKCGEAARELYANGKALLAKIIDDKLIEARGVYGFWPANSDGDDVVLFTDESRKNELFRFNMLRQQQAKEEELKEHLSLADFVAPVSSGLKDHVGAFAVTAGIGVEELAKRFEKDHDDYDAILTKALADRLAEAFAERLHAQARSDWGYGKSEALTNEDLIEEKYRGIRPAFGYPACPDHTEKKKLFELLGAPSIGMTLTETFAMHPAASVSGIYLAHPRAKYFTVGKIGRDQVEHYAARKGMSVVEVEKWLGPNLGY